MRNSAQGFNVTATEGHPNCHFISQG